MNEEHLPTPPTPTDTPPSTPIRVDDTLLMSVLAYIGVLVLIPYLVAKDKPVVKFHVQQGLILAVLEVFLWIATTLTFGLVAPLTMIGMFGLLILSVIGILNVLNHRQKELPLVGSYAKHFDI